MSASRRQAESCRGKVLLLVRQVALTERNSYRSSSVVTKMPNSLEIGLFVFGAILVFTALFGGNFKLFGAEVASTVSSIYVRVLSFFLGGLFIWLALFPLKKEVDDDKPTETVAIHNSNVALDLTGNWTGSNDLKYGIKHDGKHLEIIEYGFLNFQPLNTFFTGTLKDNKAKLISKTVNGQIIYGQQMTMQINVEDEYTINLQFFHVSGETSTVILSRTE